MVNVPGIWLIEFSPGLAVVGFMDDGHVNLRGSPENIR
jgi:hypothetical protein